MGNTSSITAKSALVVADVKDKLEKTFSSESDNNSKSSIKENPETRREMNRRHQERKEE